MKLRTLLTSFLLVCITTTAFAEDYVLGLWNIEMLSSRKQRGFPEFRNERQFPPRTDEQLAGIAEHIRDKLKIDAMIVTEVDDDGEGSIRYPRSEQLTKIVTKMGREWRYFLGRTGGGQRVGIVWNSNRIEVKKIANIKAPEFEVGDFEVEESDVFHRDPLLVHIEFKGRSDNQQPKDLLFVGLHLKSQQVRVHNHMAAVAKLLGDLNSKPVMDDLGIPDREKDIVIAGDLNDASHKRNGFRYIFDYLDGVGYTHLGPEDGSYPRTRCNRSGSQIDHIFVSPALMESGAVTENTFQVHGVENTESANMKYRRNFSDHFPLTFKLKVEEN